MTKTQTLEYLQAFDRNLGWLNDQEQEKLRRSCVAVAGLGGAGGFQIQALARLGVGHFKIADPDIFEASNINRQIGATRSTLGALKTDVTRDMILSINPSAKVEAISEPIQPSNLDAFLESASLAIDGIDFFEQNAKLLLMRKCREKKIPALTCCPLGFGASLLIFSPTGMRYEDYFDLREGMNEKDMRRSVTCGLSPTPLCMKYMDQRALNEEKKRAASVSPGLMLVGAMTATAAVKIITGKGKVRYCPHVYQIDLMTQQVKRSYYRWGMKSPWMQFKKWAFFTFMDIQSYFLLHTQKTSINPENDRS